MELQFFCPQCRVSYLSQGENFECPCCGAAIEMKSGYYDAGMPAKVGFTLERTHFLADLERGHFWFGPRDILLKVIFRRVAPEARRIAELGCGTGRFLSFLKAEADLLVGVEAFENSIQAAASRNLKAVLLRADVTAVPVEDGAFDAAVSMDVLEHVEPARFLKEAHRIVRQGGYLVLSVPAGSILWSEVDVKAGHRCRYTLPMISKELQESGWQLRGHTHYQFLLYPLMVISRVFFKGKNDAERKPGVVMNKVLGAINAFEVCVLSRLSLPWGSSLIVWARKT